MQAGCCREKPDAGSRGGGRDSLASSFQPHPTCPSQRAGRRPDSPELPWAVPGGSGVQALASLSSHPRRAPTQIQVVTSVSMTFCRVICTPAFLLAECFMQLAGLCFARVPSHAIAGNFSAASRDASNCPTLIICSANCPEIKAATARGHRRPASPADPAPLRARRPRAPPWPSDLQAQCPGLCLEGGCWQGPAAGGCPPRDTHAGQRGRRSPRGAWTETRGTCAGQAPREEHTQLRRPGSGMRATATPQPERAGPRLPDGAPGGRAGQTLGDARPSGPRSLTAGCQPWVGPATSTP